MMLNASDVWDKKKHEIGFYNMKQPTENWDATIFVHEEVERSTSFAVWIPVYQKNESQKNVDCPPINDSTQKHKRRFGFFSHGLG